MVDAYSLESIADGIMRLATDAALRSELRQKGFEQAKQFSWEKTVKKAMDWIESKQLLA
jgi:glycosyltransferase involved in cell wall biosynthesis